MNRGGNNGSEKDRKNTAATASKSEMKPRQRSLKNESIVFGT